MFSLEEITARLASQTLDQRGLILPEEGRIEGVRQALERMNSFLGLAHTLQGLDGATQTSIPEAFEYTLLVGSRAYALSYLLGNRVGNLLKPVDTLPETELLLQHLWRQFDMELDRLRKLALQSAENPWYGTWTWSEKSGFSA